LALQYIFGLQEATVVAMADGFAQATRRPAFVNLQSAADIGNEMCNIMSAFLNKTPLIITAWQQTREMIICDPYLTNRDETMLPRPLVKWAYQIRPLIPLVPEEVSAAMRHCSLAKSSPHA
jgi:benzoylformate decarboxylase